MASLECSNNKCRKMIGYDTKNNIQVVASSEYCKPPEEDDCINIDVRCARCKRHNYLVLK